MEPLHQPAMVNEVLEYLRPAEGKTLADLTTGSAGHLAKLLQAGAFVYGLDRDLEALERAERVLAPWRGQFKLIHGRMSNVAEILAAEDVDEIDGCLIDAGLSMDQMMADERGFSVHSETRLDMRMDRSEPGDLTAYDVVNSYLESQLLQVFSIIGNRREARRVARRIVLERQRQPICTAEQLAAIVAPLTSRGHAVKNINAAPYLMAIRAEVNDEASELRSGIESAADLLSPSAGARLVALTWNSSEHRISRQTMRRIANPCTCPPALPCSCGQTPIVKLLTPKFVEPSEEEVSRNPASRSARLMAVERL